MSRNTETVPVITPLSLRYGELLIQPQGGVIAKNRRAIHAHKLFVGTPNHTRERLVGILDHAALVGQDDAVHKRAVDAVEELLLLIGNLIQLEQFGAFRLRNLKNR